MSLSRKDKPLYIQIANIIKDRILHGVYPIGLNIPSEPQLEQEFNVSKITVRGAIQELVQEGFLEKGSGKGTKVIRNTSSSKLSKWKKFTEILVDEGHQIRKQWMKAERVYNEVGSEPYRLFGEHCIRLERIYSLNDIPYVHYTHYLVNGMDDLDVLDLNAQSLYELLEERSVSLEKLRDEFSVAVPPPDVEEILLLDKKRPLLKRTRYSYDELGKVTEYSIGFYNTELQNYVVNYEV
ncbi:GntR family transcriptional regulator [Paenibacillus sp. VTT E-133280]|uniref:GntR family transcriptional regulator n=1 Tax=Paenibacillus sp. VTT E-133280 TaxID=1986222 RepID=UPI000BA1247B|nr:GntR family transcriptional regulator [Paenibacillus sp. VTT E-133280]OZQ60448.1 GntR family transcriptional regulator [Paenibacillus sp. VTT E-133280]